MKDKLHPIVAGRWVVLVLFVALCGWLVPGINQLQHDDDVLAFLPPDHPDVQTFNAVAERFGMLEVGLVGVLPEEGHDDVLQPESIAKLRALHTTFTEVSGVRLVLSLPAFPSVKVQDEVLVVDELVPDSIDDPAVIRQRALSNADAVGNVVSADGKAAAFLVFLSGDSSPERFANRARILGELRAATEETWSGPTFYGGGPFIEHNASESSRQDIEKLSPIVIGVLVVVSALLLGSTTAAVLNLLVTGLGVGLIVGAHGRFDEAFTIVSSTTPVMMVALGGAFGMHVLAGYQRQEGTPPERANATLRELWIPVVLSGLTTATAFFALIVMPQQPMQRFGVVAGIGVLLLLVLSLLVLPALLAVLPARLLPTRPNRVLPRPPAPPALVLALLAVAGVAGAVQMQADPDTANVFDEQSEPRQANRFFEENFGGSQFLQLAVDVDLKDPIALRKIREIEESVRQVEGVAEVRSLIGPVAQVTEGFGGRRGIPSTLGRSRTVVANLADHPAASQLMLSTADGAVVHIKLAPADSAGLVRTTEAVRAIVEEHPDGTLRVGPTTDAKVDEARREHVRHRVTRISGTDLTPEQFGDLVSTGGQTPQQLLPDVVALRKRALGTDELIEPLPAAVYERLEPKTLLDTRGKALEDYIRTTLPELVEADAEGIEFVAEFLGRWIDEAKDKRRLVATCVTVGLPPLPEPPQADPDAMPGEDPPESDAGAAEPEDPGVATCREVIAALRELGDEQWEIPSGAKATVERELPFSSRLTGQPLIGQAFADSVTQSLRSSTLVSLGALALVLLVARQVRALLPAVWTLAVTFGTIWVLGHPISIGTSMVSCIALGAGVDFAIHLGIRARALGGDDGGERATDELGGVIGMAGLQLAMAFCVLLASTMPPLRQLGGGLAIALMLAAIGSVWLTPRLYRRR